MSEKHSKSTGHRITDTELMLFINVVDRLQKRAYDLGLFKAAGEFGTIRIAAREDAAMWGENGSMYKVAP